MMVCALLSLSHFVSSVHEYSADDFDFWIGDWVMDSRQPTDLATKGEWQKGLCKNTVSREYEKVVREDFDGLGLKGGSWSVFDPASKKWRQTWVDTTGSYLLFEGGKLGDEVVLTQTNAKKGHARMRFANITKDAFDWFWEGSSDGGQWTLNWHLKYKRRAKQGD